MAEKTTRKMQNVMVLLLGFPGTGKLTISEYICSLYRFKLIDNTTINAPILRMIDVDGKTPIPEAAWDEIAKLRQVIFGALTTLPNPKENFVFTLYLSNECTQNHEIFKQYLDTAQRRHALFFPIRLVINEEENKKRIVSPARREKLKDISVKNTAWRHQNETVLNTDHENEMTLDVTEVPANIAAEKIINHVKTVLGNHG